LSFALRPTDLRKGYDGLYGAASSVATLVSLSLSRRGA
jgi:hypothetical protein